MKGAVYDVVVDLRTDAPTFCKWISVEITEENRLSILVPDGCANAFLTLSDNTWMLYLHSGFYAPGFEGGVRYNDPHFNFKWPVDPKVISDTDRQITPFNPKEFSL
jgi:dTDP-4-dehydrorhamnose 3,5-epimerase